MMAPPQEEIETAFLYIPETAVGAVIGSKGTNIKNIMRLSSARIKVTVVTQSINCFTELIILNY